MARRRVPVAILLLAGVLLSLAGVVAMGIGWFDPSLISDQLPPDAAIDGPAVGGAAVALGAAVGLLGLVHAAIAAALSRGVGLAPTAGVVLAASMTVLSFAFAVSALVSIASQAAPAVLMLPAAVGLGAAGIAYGATTLALIGARKGPI